LRSADDEEGVDRTLAGRRHPAHDLGPLHDQFWVGGLKGCGNLTGREEAGRIGPALSFGTVQAVVATISEQADDYARELQTAMNNAGTEFFDKRNT